MSGRDPSLSPAAEMASVPHAERSVPAAIDRWKRGVGPAYTPCRLGLHPLSVHPASPVGWACTNKKVIEIMSNVIRKAHTLRPRRPQGAAAARRIPNFSRSQKERHADQPAAGSVEWAVNLCNWIRDLGLLAPLAPESPAGGREHV